MSVWVGACVHAVKYVGAARTPPPVQGMNKANTWYCILCHTRLTDISDIS